MTTGPLDKCKYLLENTKYSTDSMGAEGYWLETLMEVNEDCVWTIGSYNRNIDTMFGCNHHEYSVRPTIEVLKTDIDY